MPDDRTTRSPAEPPSPEAPAGLAPKQRVQDEIRRDIILGNLAAGTRITEAALAAKYGISRVPIREALRALEAEGFVESRPYAGSTVSAIPVDDADDLFAVREALEAATARRAARRAAAQLSTGKPEDNWWQTRRELAHILDAGDTAIEQGSLELLPELNIQFHLGVAELAASSSLTALLRQIAGKIEWLYASDVDSRGKQSWSEHRAILAAIDAGRIEEAEQGMGAHVHHSRTGYLSRFAAGTAAPS